MDFVEVYGTGRKKQAQLSAQLQISGVTINPQQ